MIYVFVLNVFKFRRDLAPNVLVSPPDMYRLGINAMWIGRLLKVNNYDIVVNFFISVIT